MQKNNPYIASVLVADSRSRGIPLPRVYAFPGTNMQHLEAQVSIIINNAREGENKAFSKTGYQQYN